MLLHHIITLNHYITPFHTTYTLITLHYTLLLEYYTTLYYMWLHYTTPCYRTAGPLHCTVLLQPFHTISHYEYTIYTLFVQYLYTIYTLFLHCLYTILHYKYTIFHTVCTPFHTIHTPFFTLFVLTWMHISMNQIIKKHHFNHRPTS